MSNTPKGKTSPLPVPTGSSVLWREDMLRAYYEDYLERLTSSQLDREFRREVLDFTQLLKALPEHNRQLTMALFADMLDGYIALKIEKEMENTFHKLLKV